MLSVAKHCSCQAAEKNSAYRSDLRKVACKQCWGFLVGLFVVFGWIGVFLVGFFVWVFLFVCLCCCRVLRGVFGLGVLVFFFFSTGICSKHAYS